MMSSVSGQVCSAPAPIAQRAPASRSTRSTQAAAPSPNSAEEITSALAPRSPRKASVHNSTATTSTTSPGSARASRAPSARPATPPPQPRPNTGTRSALGLKPISAPTRASRLGVAMPVDETVTMTSTSRAARRARSSAALRGLHEQRAGAFEIGLRALGPVARRQEPFERAHRIAPLDAGIDENVGELGIARQTAAVDRARGLRDRGLLEHVRRHRRGEAQQAYRP